MKNNKKTEIQNVVTKMLFNKGLKKKKLNKDYDFVKSGDLDSLNVILLISDIEKKFKFKFKKNHLQKKNFHTLSEITSIVYKNTK